jgi:hypothetical protein
VQLLPRPLWIALTVIISLAWLANLVVGWLGIGQTETAVNFIFGAVVGSLYVVRPRAAEAAKNIVDAISGKAADEKPPRGDSP